MNDWETQLDNLRERIEAAEELSSDDQEVLSAFDDRLTLLATDYSDARHVKLLRHCTIMAERCGGLHRVLTSKEESERLVGWINDNFSNEESNRDYRVALRVFGRRVTEDDDVPSHMEWIPTGTSSNYDPSPDPRDMLDWEGDVEAMIDAAKNPRDAAMFALQFDAGLRGGEFKRLDYGDIQDNEHGLQVTVDGKQGRRTVLLIPSVPYVSRWRDEHPGGDGDPLWSKLSATESVSDRMIYKAFRESAKRAGVTKPVTLTNFRKSSAAFLAARNLNQAHIEDHHGWVRGSSVASRYISTFGQDTDREVARAHGVEIDAADEPADVSPVECPRCGTLNARSADFCSTCSQTFDREAKELLDELTSSMDERLIEADDHDTRRDLVGARQEIESSPEEFTKEELHEFASSFSEDSSN